MTRAADTGRSSAHGGSLAKVVYTAVPGSSTGLHRGVPDKTLLGEVQGREKALPWCGAATDRRYSGLEWLTAVLFLKICLRARQRTFIRQTINFTIHILNAVSG